MTVEVVEERSSDATNGHTKRVTIIYFLIVIALVPVLQLVAELAHQEPIQELEVFRSLPTVERLTSYERALEKNSVAARVVRQRVQWLGLIALRAGNQKATVGADWSLFYMPSLDAALKPGFMASSDAPGNPVDAIAAFRDALADRGVELIVLAVPGKEAIYPEWLRAGYDPRRGPAVNPDMQAFAEALRARNVDLLDPTDLLWKHKPDGELYLRDDTHWTPLGLALVADELARRLPQSVFGDEGYRLELRQASAKGDLVDMLQLPDLPTPLRAQTVTVQRVINATTGQPVEPDTASPVTVLGDSFTNIYSLPEMGWGDHAGLSEQLAYRLGRPVDLIAMNDGGVNTARAALARRRGGLTGKSLVIWQFAARDLVVSNGQWETIAMPKPTRE